MVVLIFLSMYFLIKKYFFLDSISAARELKLFSAKQIVVCMENNQEFKIEIVDKLLIFNCLSLYYTLSDERFSENNQTVISPVEQYEFKVLLSRFKQEIAHFFGFKRRVLHISEESVGSEKFRQLLRNLEGF